MVVFDITNAESFAKAKNWVKELQRQGNPNMIMALAGNKADLAAQRSVTADEAKVLPCKRPAGSRTLRTFLWACNLLSEPQAPQASACVTSGLRAQGLDRGIEVL